MKEVRREGKNFFTCNPSALSTKISFNSKSTTVLESIDYSTKRNDLLFSRLCEYIEKCEGRALEEREKNNYRNSFCDYLMNSNWPNVKELQYFSNFILTIKDNEELMDILSDLKEGVVLYEGVRYCGDLSKLGSWKTKLTLVCDTEVLFSLCGYNDEASQELCVQLEKYIREINRKEKMISLCYFPETREELVGHFNKAKDIIAGKDIQDPTKTAMNQILAGNPRFSDIDLRRAELFAKLKAKDINQIDRDFYDVNVEDNKFYNLESLDIKDKYSKLWGYSPESIWESVRTLSHINILRQGENDKGFENCRYIFLTATNKTLRLSGASEFVTNGNVPLATTYDFLINHFWFKLNKGFGNGNKPRTVDMITKARSVLYGIIQRKASDTYEQFMSNMGQTTADGTKVNVDYFIAINQELRSVLKQPEDLTPENVDDAISFFENWDLDEAIRRKEAQDHDFIAKDGIIAQKNEELAQKDEQLKKANVEKQRYKDTISDKDKQLKEVNSEKGKLTEQVENVQKERDKYKAELESLKRDNADKKAKKEKIITGVSLAVIILLSAAALVLFSIGIYFDHGLAKVVSALLGLTDFIAMGISLAQKRLKAKKDKKTNEGEAA